MHRLRSYLFAVWFLAFCAAQGFAANVRWTGAAQDVRQVTTITATGTFATGDTVTLTINNKSVTVTVGSATSTSNIADILARAVDAANSTEDLLGNETRNFGGEEIPEFAEIDASASGAVLTLTSEVPGVPFTITRSEVTAGDGALGAVTPVTAATGKNWLSNAANYDTGTVPVDNDVLYIDQGDVDILYALDHFRANNIDLDLYVANTYTGQIGLPPKNGTSANEYAEYRTPRYFQYRGGSKECQFIQGVTTATTQGRVWMDFQDQSGVDIRIGCFRGPVSATPTIFIAGSPAASNVGSLTVTRGAVSVEPDDAPTDSTKMFRPSSTFLGAQGGAATDVYVYFGRRARLQYAVDHYINSGTIVMEAATHDGVTSAITQMRGGTLELRMPGDSTVNGTFNVYAGATLYPVGLSQISSVNVYGGTLDYRRGAGAFDTNTVNLYAGGALYDPNGLSVDIVDLVGCKISQVTLDVPSNRRIDFATTATP